MPFSVAGACLVVALVLAFATTNVRDDRGYAARAAIERDGVSASAQVVRHKKTRNGEYRSVRIQYWLHGTHHETDIYCPPEYGECDELREPYRPISIQVNPREPSHLRSEYGHFSVGPKPIGAPDEVLDYSILTMGYLLPQILICAAIVYLRSRFRRPTAQPNSIAARRAARRARNV